jgi:spore germination protein GerM
LDRPFHLRDTAIGWKPTSRLVRAVQILAVLAVVAVGFWLRSLSTTKASFGFVEWPWARTATVTLYFSDGRFLFPVSRHMPANGELPNAVLHALLAGPDARSNLKSWIPPGTEIRSFSFSNGTAQIDLSRAFLDSSGSRPDLAKAAIIETMTAVPGVSSVALSVEGTPFTASAVRMPILYYASPAGLVALPTSASEPRAALAAYLSGPGNPELTGFPSDVKLLSYQYAEANRSLSLNFTYTPTLRTLALDQPERMRLVLLGLIATLTEFSGVQTVQLDFQGQTRLGLGQCSDLLRTPQPRPQLLNDERLLDR